MALGTVTRLGRATVGKRAHVVVHGRGLMRTRPALDLAKLPVQEALGPEIPYPSTPLRQAAF
jgi:hypothetical protein